MAASTDRVSETRKAKKRKKSKSLFKEAEPSTKEGSTNITLQGEVVKDNLLNAEVSCTKSEIGEKITMSKDVHETRKFKNKRKKAKSLVENTASPIKENSSNTVFKKNRREYFSNSKAPFTNRKYGKDAKYKNSKYKYHLTKDLRVPMMYKEAARILEDVEAKKASVKNLVFSLRRDIRKIYAIVVETLKYRNVISQLTKKSRLFQKEKHLDPYLARVLIYDMLFGRKSLTGDSKPVQTVLKHRGDITKALQRFMEESSVKSPEELLEKSVKVNFIPRYARVNTLLTTTEKVKKELKECYQQEENDEAISLDEFYNLVKNLEKGHFLQDINFSDLFIFSHQENLSQTELYNNGHIILEDKTSYLAAKALAPPEGSTVFDGCAAPGIKTTHLAALMNNEGKIFACDVHEKRMEMLKDMIQFTGVKCCSFVFDDFTNIDPNDEQYSSVEYILLDPTCSGSGMVSRLDSLTDDEHSKSFKRIQGLSEFQKVILKHALTFKNLKRLVYSTCSINVEENEEVVKEALSGWEETYKVVNALPDWPTRGKEEYEFGSLCLRAYPQVNYTNGFFIAVIEKIDGSKQSKKKKKKVKNEEDIAGAPYSNESSTVLSSEFITQEAELEDSKHTSYQENVEECKRKHKKKRKLRTDQNATEATVTTTEKKSCSEIESTREHKKTKKHNKECDPAEVSSSLCQTDVSQSSTKKRKMNETTEVPQDESSAKKSSKKHKKKKVKECDPAEDYSSLCQTDISQCSTKNITEEPQDKSYVKKNKKHKKM